MVAYVENQEEFEKLLAANKLMVVDFTASWCGPCKMVAPKYEEFSKEYTNVGFFKVDVDNNSETAEEYGITAMPTFKFFKDGKEVAGLEIKGANADKIKAHLDKLVA